MRHEVVESFDIQRRVNRIQVRFNASCCCMSSQGLEEVCEDHPTTMLNKVSWQLLVLSLGILGGGTESDAPMPIYRISEYVAKP